MCSVSINEFTAIFLTSREKNESHRSQQQPSHTSYIAVFSILIGTKQRIGLTTPCLYCQKEGASFQPLHILNDFLPLLITSGFTYNVKSLRVKKKTAQQTKKINVYLQFVMKHVSIQTNETNRTIAP